MQKGLAKNTAGFFPQSSDMIIKVACMDMMLLTPTFIGKTTGTAFLDQIDPFFIGTPGVSFFHV